MNWLEESWGSRTKSQKRIGYLGVMGEEFLATHVRAALAPARCAGVILGLGAKNEKLGDFDMIIHINQGGSHDHVMIVDAKNVQNATLRPDQKDKAQRRIAELIASGGLGETREGANDGYTGVVMSYHFVFSGPSTTKHWQADARTGEVVTQHNPSTAVHENEHQIVLSSYETFLGDVLCRAMKSTKADTRGPRFGTFLLDRIASAYGVEGHLSPHVSILEREDAYRWCCEKEECWAHPRKKNRPTRGWLHAHLHSAFDAKQGRHKRGKSTPPLNFWGYPDWDRLLKFDEELGWEEGTAARRLLFGPRAGDMPAHISTIATR